VLEAKVAVEGSQVAQIGAGLLVLLGVGKGDGPPDVEWLSEKVAHLRIFEDAAGKMNVSLLDASKDIIVVSQFTLYGDASKGRRPSFTDAALPDEAKRLYEGFCERLRRLGLNVQTGIFAADMKVSLCNDGPVTLLLDSASRAS
jgi:D-tyrosyl-tRNA(Tyr) deacylase